MARTLLLGYALISLGCAGWMPVWAERGLALAFASALLAAAAARAGVATRLCVAAVVPAAGLATQELLHVGGALDASVVIGLWWAGRSSGSPAEAGALARAALAVTCLRFFLGTPAGFHAERAFHAVLVAPLRLAGIDLSGWGPSVTGSRCVLAGAVVLVTAAGPSWKRRTLVAGALATAGLLGAALTHVALGSGARIGSEPAGADGRLLACAVPWIPLVAVLLVAVLVRPMLARNATGGAWPLGVCACLAFAGFVADARVRASGAPVEWMVYEKGLVSWGRPGPQLYGQESGGMLGTLPEFIGDLGCRTSFRKDLADLGAGERRGLVLINVEETLDARATAEVTRFATEGGRVLVVGDHTWVQSHDASASPRIVLNDLLTNTSIRFENDSADPTVPGWWDATLVARRGLPAVSAPANPCGAVVGGALTIGWPAAPLVIGRFGYRDAGLSTYDPRRGWLGNLLWDPAEPFGDVVLAAEERVGAGKIIVVGDTTGLMNLGRPLSWRWWADVFTHEDGATGGQVLGQILLLAGAAVAFLRRLERWRARDADVVLVVSGLMVVALASAPKRPADLLAGSRSIAVLDTSVCPRGKTASWENEGRLSLLTGIHRSGFLPFVGSLRHDGLAEHASLLVIAGPQAALGRREADGIVDWVRAGGTCLIGASYDEAANVAPILDAAGVRVSGVVLGPCTGVWRDSASSVQWASFLEAWGLEVAEGRAKPVVTVDGQPVVASAAVGRGRVVVVADSRFLSNSALEGRWGHHQGNVDLLRELTARTP